MNTNTNTKFNKVTLKKLIDNLNEGTISYSDLPEEFKINKEKIKIPVRPVEPYDGECCGSGCRPCVYDIYEEKLSKYEEEIEELMNILNS